MGLERAGEYADWIIYKSSVDGHYEAHRSVNPKVITSGVNMRKEARDIKRLVLMAKDISSAVQEVELRTSARRPPRYNDKDQLNMF